MSIMLKEIKEEDTRLGRHFAVWSGFNSSFMDYDDLGFSRDSIENYIKEHPFPKDKHYSEEEVVDDFTSADGSVTMSCEKEETADWVVEMINKFITVIIVVGMVITQYI